MAFTHPSGDFTVEPDSGRHSVIVVVQDVGGQHRRVLLTVDGARALAQQLQTAAAAAE